MSTYQNSADEILSVGSTDRVNSLYDAFSAGELDAFAALCATDVEWIQSEGFPYGGRHVGARAVLEGVRNTLDHYWEGFGFERREVRDLGDALLVIGVYTGTHRATGSPVRAEAAHVLEFEGGLLRRFRQFTDTKLFHDAATSFSHAGEADSSGEQVLASGGIDDLKGIAAALEHYLLGARTGESSIMRLAFHDQATTHGTLGGELISGPIQVLFDWHDQNGPAERLDAKVRSVEVSGLTAHAVVELRDWTGVDFIDRFSFSKERGRWSIVHKSFEVIGTS